MNRRLNFLKNRATAGRKIKERVRFFADLYGVKVKRITIRDQKTRWGSCSKLGNLNFNYKIVFLPQRYMDYVVVHEICHLIEFNHSKRFWFQVARVFPDYARLRGVLRKVNLAKIVDTITIP